MSARETIARPYKIAVSTRFDVVYVELVCGDEYAASVLHEDIVDRLQRGEGLTLSLEQSPAPAVDEKTEGEGR